MTKGTRRKKNIARKSLLSVRLTTPEMNRLDAYVAETGTTLSKVTRGKLAGIISLQQGQKEGAGV